MLIAAPSFAQDAAVAVEAAVPVPDKGDTTWMLVSAILVMMMTLPGLALFYGGLVRAKNMLSVLMQVLTVFSLMAILWVAFGYSLAFTGAGTAEDVTFFTPYIGGLSKMFLSGVGTDSVVEGFTAGVVIPELSFVIFQMAFACIASALIVGATAERLKFSAILMFIVIWFVFSYLPMAHMVWWWGGPSAYDAPSGLLFGHGALDFAGGTVIHINAGVAGLIAAWVASTLRAARDSRGLPALGPAGDDRLQVLAVEEPYAEFFSVQEITLRHRRHRGGWTPEVLRAVFVSGDAAVVLPWDPLRDRVLLIDQFRAGPAARGDRQPWFWEAPAGRVDPTETPEQAVLREAIEETGLAIDRLIPGPHNYPSPGLLAEFLYLYVGIADLPDDVAGFGGLDTENEDIRSQLLPRAELTRMALAGQVRNGPLLSLALWLELNQQKIRMELGQDKPGLIP